jgi:Uma2 family endonuclease
MSVTLVSPPAAETEDSEQRFVMGGIPWDAYVTISDALDEHSGVRLIYIDGRLTLMGKSRRHERSSELLGHLVLAVAAYLQIDCEPSGEATVRSRPKGAGLEGDRTFHFGANALQMRGLENYDFDHDPPPDLAIEVEATHPADDAIAAWGRLGVPEVWRFDATTLTCTFWNRREDGTYGRVNRGMFLPMLDPSDVENQIRRAKELGSSNWYRQLEEWVRDVIRPRLDSGIGN